MLIFPSTNSGYGVGEANIECDESTPLRPVSSYGRWKVELEAYLLDRRQLRYVPVCDAVRHQPAHAARPAGQRLHLPRVPRIASSYCSSRTSSGTTCTCGTALRAFRHALAQLLRHEGAARTTSGLSDANISKWELCQAIAEFVPDFAFLVAEVGKDPDQRNYIVSNKRIEDAGFRATRGLRAGIQELIQGYQVVRRNQHSNV